ESMGRTTPSRASKLTLFDSEKPLSSLTAVLSSIYLCTKDYDYRQNSGICQIRNPILKAQSEKAVDPGSRSTSSRPNEWDPEVYQTSLKEMCRKLPTETHSG